MLTFAVVSLLCLVFPPLILGVIGFWIAGIIGGIVGLIIGLMIFS